jgi:hypothetical protein
MTNADQIRNWLGIYFLGTTAVLGTYIILFQQTVLLPISSEDASSAFKIIIPTFIAQLTVVFKWIANPPKIDTSEIIMPRWAVMGPPIIVLFMLIISLTYIIIDQGRSNGGEIFKNVVTFCVSLLSATSVFVISTVFGMPSQPPRT